MIFKLLWAVIIIVRIPHPQKCLDTVAPSLLRLGNSFRPTPSPSQRTHFFWAGMDDDPFPRMFSMMVRRRPDYGAKFFYAAAPRLYCLLFLGPSLLFVFSIQLLCGWRW